MPLEETPISCTVRKIKDTIFVDPCRNEDKFTDARLTAAFTKKGDLCAFQKGGDETLTEDDLSKMIDLAKKVTLKYRKVLK